MPDGAAFGVDLRREMIDFGLPWHGCRRLMQLGFDGRLIAELGAQLAIGQARVQISRDGYHFEPHGPDARLLLAVLERGDFVDICAVSTSDADSWALRIGQGWCLGHDDYDKALNTSLRERQCILRVFGSPLDWLRAGCAGICVLDWVAALPELRLLSERVQLKVDAGAGERMRALLAYGDLPRVSEAPPVRIQEREVA